MITWRSTNENIATVDQNGNISAISEGTTRIIAKTTNGKTSECTVIILPPIPRVKYKTHVQTYGWQDYVSNGIISGTSGEAKRLEGIEIVLVEKGENPSARDNQNDERAFIGIES